MKTAELLEDRWTVDVEDVRDLEKDVPGYRRKFEFRGPDAHVKAWICQAEAERHGFKARAERVKRA